MKIKITKREFKENFGENGKSYNCEWTQADKDEIQKGKGYKEYEVGKEYDVEITENQYGKSIKEIKTGKKPFYSGAKADPYKTASIAMGYAKDIIVERIDNKMPSPLNEDVIKQLPKIAESIFNWIKDHPLKS